MFAHILIIGYSRSNYILEVIVEVFDTYGASVKSRTHVTVNPVALTGDSILALGESLTSLAENEDSETLLGG